MYKITLRFIICTVLIATVVASTMIGTVNAWGTPHIDQAEKAGEYADLTPDQINILKKDCLTPDNVYDGWDTVYLPWNDNLFPVEYVFYHSVRHSYLVDIADMPGYKNGFWSIPGITYQDGSLVLIRWDNAAKNASYNANEARKCFHPDPTDATQKYDPEKGYQYLAYAMHYMSDCSCPVHVTTQGLDNFPSPYNNEYLGRYFLHDAYEGYVEKNWEPGMDEDRSGKESKYYQQYICKPSPEEMYEIDDPEVASEILADIAYINFENIYDEMKKDPENWEDSDAVSLSTIWCNEEGTKFNMALIDYATR